MKRTGLIAGFFAALLVLAGCSLPAPMVQTGGASEDGGSNGGSGGGTGSTDDSPEGTYGLNTHELQAGLGDYDAYLAQDVQWHDCGGGAECAAILVPVDYEDPASQAIALAAKRTAGDDLPHLLVNPGGPGGSGVEMIGYASFYFSDELTDNFRILGWDPRGVGDSAPVHCYNTPQLRELYEAEYDVETDEGWEQFEADAGAYWQACIENTDEHLAHVGTPNTVKDMELMREVLAEPELHFLGFSYGTKLGALYADEFPETVGRFVLDGAMDLSIDSTQMTADQTEGFEVAYRAYLADCLGGATCPFTGSVDDAYQQTIELFEEVAANPVTTMDAGRDVTETDLVNATIVALYSQETWFSLSTAFSLLMSTDDGSMIAMLADIAANLDEDGNYPYDEGAIRIINCLDYPANSSRQEMIDEAERLEGLSELWGQYMGFGDVMCQQMPLDPTSGPKIVKAENAGPIVVIGTERDPATPMKWAVAMADELEEGVLISWDGDGHTAYAYNTCVSGAVDQYFIEGVLPHDGLSC